MAESRESEPFRCPSCGQAQTLTMTVSIHCQRCGRRFDDAPAPRESDEERQVTAFLRGEAGEPVVVSDELLDEELDPAMFGGETFSLRALVTDHAELWLATIYVRPPRAQAAQRSDVIACQWCDGDGEANNPLNADPRVTPSRRSASPLRMLQACARCKRRAFCIHFASKPLCVDCAAKEIE